MTLTGGEGRRSPRAIIIAHFPGLVQHMKEILTVVEIVVRVALIGVLVVLLVRTFKKG